METATVKIANPAAWMITLAALSAGKSRKASSDDRLIGEHTSRLAALVDVAYELDSIQEELIDERNLPVDPTAREGFRDVLRATQERLKRMEERLELHPVEAATPAAV